MTDKNQPNALYCVAYVCAIFIAFILGAATNKEPTLHENKATCAVCGKEIVWTVQKGWIHTEFPTPRDHDATPKE